MMKETMSIDNIQIGDTIVHKADGKSMSLCVFNIYKEMQERTDMGVGDFTYHEVGICSYEKSTNWRICVYRRDATLVYCSDKKQFESNGSQILLMPEPDKETM